MNFLRRKSTKNIECCIKNKVLNLEMDANASSLSQWTRSLQKNDSSAFRVRKSVFKQLNSIWFVYSTW